MKHSCNRFAHKELLHSVGLESGGLRTALCRLITSRYDDKRSWYNPQQATGDESCNRLKRGYNPTIITDSQSLQSSAKLQSNYKETDNQHIQGDDDNHNKILQYSQSSIQGEDHHQQSSKDPHSITRTGSKLDNLHNQRHIINNNPDTQSQQYDPDNI